MANPRCSALLLALLMLICVFHNSLAFVPAQGPSSSRLQTSSFQFQPTGTARTIPESKTTSTLQAFTPATLGVTISTLGVAVAGFYKSSPLLAGFATASLKASMADSLAQRRDVCVTKFDFKRNFAMFMYSGTILGVSCEIMYNRILPIVFGGEQTLARVIKCVLFDAFLNAPLLWLPPAYIAKALVYRYPKREAIQKYITDVKENRLLLKYWSLWIPATFLNFSVVPAHYRVAFVACVSFFWMIILSLVANNNEQDPESCPLEPEISLPNPRALD